MDLEARTQLREGLLISHPAGKQKAGLLTNWDRLSLMMDSGAISAARTKYIVCEYAQRRRPISAVYVHTHTHLDR